MVNAKSWVRFRVWFRVRVKVGAFSRACVSFRLGLWVGLGLGLGLGLELCLGLGLGLRLWFVLVLVLG